MMGDMKFTTAGNMITQKPYELTLYETYAEIYFFGQFHSKYDFISDARLMCDKLNQDFERKISILSKAFSAYNNAPRGWTFEARMERALDALNEDGWDLVKQ